jgi:hypothetical protein
VEIKFHHGNKIPPWKCKFWNEPENRFITEEFFEHELVQID